VIVIKTDSGYILQHKGMEVEVNRHSHVRDAFVCKALDELRKTIEELQATIDASVDKIEEFLNE